MFDPADVMMLATIWAAIADLSYLLLHRALGPATTCR